MGYTMSMHTMIRSAVALLAWPILAWPVLAQDRPPQGIGFAQAEEGTWLCRHEDPMEALSCAREHCAEQAPGQECWPTAWCYPANWSGTMTIWLPDFHTTQVLCGAPSEKALTDGLAALCAGDENVTSCDMVLVVDPEGNERVIEGVSFPGPAAPPPPAEAATPEAQADAAEDAPEEEAEPASNAPAGP